MSVSPYNLNMDRNTKTWEEKKEHLTTRGKVLRSRNKGKLMVLTDEACAHVEKKVVYEEGWHCHSDLISFDIYISLSHLAVTLVATLNAQ